MGVVFLIIIGIFYAIQHSKSKNVKRIPTPTRLASPISNGGNINTNKKTTSKEKSITNSPNKNMQSRHDESENNLVIFTVSVGQSESKSSNKSLGKWIKQGEQIKLKGYESDKVFFYFGGYSQVNKNEP